MALDLNYKPGVLVDTTNLSREEWLKWRKKGLGGSDIAAVFNVSPFKTKRDLYYDKANIPCAISSDEDNWVAKEVGNRLEDLVAEIFAKKTGYKVWKVKKMFYHPNYPFLIADIDFFVEMPDGKITILECKSAHYLAKTKWEDGKVPIYYEYQGRSYMSVINVDFVYFACLFGNNENDFVYYKVERDLEQEETIISEASDFWNNNVLARVEPPYVGSGDLALESIRKFHGAADKSAPKIILSNKCEDKIKTYLELKNKKQAVDKESKELENAIKQIYAPIVDEMGNACTASCKDYYVTYNPRYDVRIRKDELKKMKEENEDMYNKYVSVSESRIFDIRKITA